MTREWLGGPARRAVELEKNCRQRLGGGQWDPICGWCEEGERRALRPSPHSLHSSVRRQRHRSTRRGPSHPSHTTVVLVLVQSG